MSVLVITFSPRSSGYSLPISETDLVTTGCKERNRISNNPSFPFFWDPQKLHGAYVDSTQHLPRFYARIYATLPTIYPQFSERFRAFLRLMFQFSYFVSSLDKKWNYVVSTRHNSNGTFFRIASVFNCIHEFGSISLSLEFGMNSYGTNLHHAIVCNCPYTAKDLQQNNKYVMQKLT